MAYQIYRPGTTHTVRGIQCELKNVEQEIQFRDHLEDGWYKSPGEWEDKAASPNTEIAKSDPNHPVRVQAKEAGIEGWDTKRIATLETELDGAQE